MSTYQVRVQIWCASAEDAVRLTIIPGSVKEAEVQDLADQIQFPPKIQVPPAEDDILPL